MRGENEARHRRTRMGEAHTQIGPVYYNPHCATRVEDFRPNASNSSVTEQSEREDPEVYQACSQDAALASRLRKRLQIATNSLRHILRRSSQSTTRYSEPVPSAPANSASIPTEIWSHILEKVDTHTLWTSMRFASRFLRAVTMRELRIHFGQRVQLTWRENFIRLGIVGCYTDVLCVCMRSVAPCTFKPDEQCGSDNGLVTCALEVTGAPPAYNKKVLNESWRQWTQANISMIDVEEEILSCVGIDRTVESQRDGLTIEVDGENSRCYATFARRHVPWYSLNFNKFEIVLDWKLLLNLVCREGWKPEYMPVRTAAD